MPSDEEKRSSALIGSRLMLIRKQLGITQEQAAKAAGLTQSAVSEIENGKRAVQVSSAVKLIKLYKVPYEAVFGENRTEPLTQSEQSAVPVSFQSAAELLFALIGGSGSDELSFVCSQTLSVCLYLVFREIYRENPHNSEKIFSLTYEGAFSLAKGYVSPKVMEELRLCLDSCRADKRRIELPIEKNAELARFIEGAEQLIKAGSSQK
ncbi:MAG: helix-turn-helix domain-containing protein [Ruminococcus sp.]|nr:helix-turn-helix domain-containing protein [Ruminococcus sp.]